MISAMVVVDHGACVELLTTAGAMVVPAALDLSKRRLQTRFILDFGDRQRKREDDREVYGIVETGCLWSHFDVLFQRGTKKGLTKKAISEALRGSEAVPIETQIRINLEPKGDNATVTEQSKLLIRLSETVTQSLEHSRCQNDRPVRLKLELMYLNLHAIDNHTLTINATTELLKTGVTVETLRLPAYISLDRRDTARYAVARANLLCAVFDNRANRHSPTHREVSVRGFVAPRGTMSTPRAYQSFYSALAGSRQLKAFYLQTLENAQDDLAMAWLAYALFSKHSTAPVEMLLLARLDLDEQLIDCWARVVEAENPLQLLHGVSDGARVETTSVPPAITVPSKTMIQLPDVAEDVRLPCAWDGVIIDDDETKRTIQVLLPGFGICTIDREALPNKRSRVAHKTAPEASAVRKAPLRHLFVRFCDFTNRERDPDSNFSELFSRVMGLLGRDLTALRVIFKGVDVQALIHGIVRCPHLRTLDVFGGEDASMNGLLELYDRGCQISSLDIMSISTQSVEALLDALTIGSTHPIYGTLKKLRLRDSPLRSIQTSTMQKLIRVARENRVLVHVEADRFRQDASIPWDELSSCDGQVEVQAEPFPLASRYAFLGALQNLSHDSEAFRLHVDAITSVFGFAAPTQPRIVHVEVGKSLTWW